LTAAVLALLPGLETVLVPLAAAVDELFADAVAAVVEPLQQRLAAAARFFGQETEFYSKIPKPTNETNQQNVPCHPPIYNRYF